MVMAEKIVGERHHLGTLKMRIPGHHNGNFRFCLPEIAERRAQQPFIEDLQFISYEKPHIKGYLIVAASARMQLLPRFGLLDEPRLDMHMNIFKRIRKRECPRSYLFLYLIKPFYDRLCFRFREDPDLFQHPGMRLAALNVMMIELPVKINGSAEPFEERIGAVLEPSPPRLHDLAPKRAVPIRTIVAPSCMAISKSEDIPIESSFMSRPNFWFISLSVSLNALKKGLAPSGSSV